MRTTDSCRRLAAFCAAACLALASPAAAQDSNAPGARQFGAWLDDASAPVAGEGQMTIAVGRWSMPGISQTNLPILASGIALTDRFQLSASVPFYRLNVGGATASGLDNVYLGAKFNVIDPTINLNEFGLAVGSIVEIASAGSAEGRTHFVVPVSLELRRAPFRWYGSAGYFSRGSFFTGGAMEWAGPRGLSLTAMMTQSVSTHAQPELDALAVPRRRLDLSGGAALPVGRQISAFANLGRSVSGMPSGSNPVVLTAGVSMWFRAPTFVQ